MTINIALTNLGKYNEGELVFTWLELPAAEEELEAAKKEIDINEQYEEWFITDYETDVPELKIGEYDSIDDLNELAEKLADMDECELDDVYAIMETGYYRDIDEALEALENGSVTIYGAADLEELAEELVDEGCFGNIPDCIKNYIDYAAIARDLSFDSYYETSRGVVRID